MTSTSNVTPEGWRKIALRGLLTWLLPFVASVPLVGRDGTPHVDMMTFKTIMLLVGGLVGLVMLIRTVPRLPQPVGRHALQVGGLWLAINWLLDIAVLLPMSGMGFGDWVLQIGLRYFSIPMVVWGAGVCVERAMALAER